MHALHRDEAPGVLRELGRTPSDVAAVVLTHGHFDHVGFARRAQQTLGVPVHAPETEQRDGPQIVSKAATGASDQALRSLDRLAALDGDVLLTGHGPAWRDGFVQAVGMAQELGPT